MIFPLKKQQNYLVIGVSLFVALFFLYATSLQSFAYDLNESWPQFKKSAQQSRLAKKPRKKAKRKYSKRRKKYLKKRIRRKVTAHTKRKVLRKYRKKRMKRKYSKKRKPSSMSRMSNHDAESKRKHKVITVKTFEEPDVMTEAAKVGESLFDEHCIGCHGKNALGTESGPPLLHDYYRPGHHGDLAIYAAPTYGVEAHHWKFGNMPKIEAVSKKDVHNLIIYIRTLQRANGIY